MLTIFTLYSPFIHEGLPKKKKKKLYILIHVFFIYLTSRSSQFSLRKTPGTATKRSITQRLCHKT